MKPAEFVIVAAAVAIVAATGGYWIGIHHIDPAVIPPPAPAAAAAPAVDPARKVLYWYDPMYPQQRFDHPGKSPFMDMMLVPKYADDGDNEDTVRIRPQVAQNLGMRTAEARLGSLAPKLTAVGSVEYDERSVVMVHTRVAGYVERLYARAPFEPVRKDDPLVEILSPDLAEAQEEYLLTLQVGEEREALRGAARGRLMLLGMSKKDVAELERMRRTHSRVTLTAPVSGVIAELGVRQGMAVTTGMTLFRIVDLATVWVHAEVPEAQAARLHPGARVAARVPAWPQETFRGTVIGILPEVNVQTRTVRARIEIANPGAKLRPGMFASLEFAAPQAAPRALLVPSEAVIRSGERNVVILAEAEGKFRPVDVEVGMEVDGQIEIRKGIKVGDRVVASGQFLIDSEASLRATLDRLRAPAARQ